GGPTPVKPAPLPGDDRAEGAGVGVALGLGIVAETAGGLPALAALDDVRHHLQGILVEVEEVDGAAGWAQVAPARLEGGVADEGPAAGDAVATENVGDVDLVVPFEHVV